MMYAEELGLSSKCINYNTEAENIVKISFYIVIWKDVGYSYLHLCSLIVFRFLEDFAANFSVMSKLKPCD